MSEPAGQTIGRDAALAGFDEARAQFEQAFSSVPDEALSYCPEGDDYAVGGLVVHVTRVLDEYARVFDQIRAADFGEVRASGDSNGVERQQPGTVAAGFERHERPAALAAMRSAHDELAGKIRATPQGDYSRQAPVRFGEAAEPYPTGAADILGWMTEHYRDHAGQIGDLLAAWKANTA